MKNRKMVFGGLIVSGMVLAVFLLLQARQGNPLDLPTKFLVVALVPTVVGFILGGYVRKIKTPIISAELENLPEAPQRPPSPLESSPTDWQLERDREKARTHGYMLVHVYRPSAEPGQVFDIFIFIVRYQKGATGPPKRKFREIEKAEFFFGESWGNEVFSVSNTGDIIGVRTHAWGTFLATCRVTFKDQDREHIILHRYIDFEMASKAA